MCVLRTVLPLALSAPMLGEVSVVPLQVLVIKPPSRGPHSRLHHVVAKEVIPVERRVFIGRHLLARMHPKHAL